jgi:hypothetical protein
VLTRRALRYQNNISESRIVPERLWLVGINGIVALQEENQLPSLAVLTFSRAVAGEVDTVTLVWKMALDSFTQLNSIVSVYEPDTKYTNSDEALGSCFTPAPPNTILILSWAGAAPRYIEKYVALYTAMFPAARIILTTSGIENFIYRSNKKQRRLVAPVVACLQDKPGDKLLVHVMSNGGAKQWATINTAYFNTTGHVLTNEVTIIDSAPGRARYKQSLTCMIRILPRPLVLCIPLSIAFVVISLKFLADLFPGHENVLDVMRRELNDSGLMSESARRCYIYSAEDDTIDWKDVEDHARQAEASGWSVTMVKFDGSQHVCHLRQDPIKYWQAIESAWTCKN